MEHNPRTREGADAWQRRMSIPNLTYQNVTRSIQDHSAEVKTNTSVIHNLS